MSIQGNVISKQSFLSATEIDFSMNEKRHDVLQENVSINTDKKNDENDMKDVV